MAEKRFQWIYIKDTILELRDDGIVKVFNNERLEELLNELADENEQLKSDLNDLCEERNYFKRKKCEYWNKFNHIRLDNIKLRKENEQLKQQIKELKE